jgi:hypothetical protein
MDTNTSYWLFLTTPNGLKAASYRTLTSEKSGLLERKENPPFFSKETTGMKSAPGRDGGGFVALL